MNSEKEDHEAGYVAKAIAQMLGSFADITANTNAILSNISKRLLNIEQLALSAHCKECTGCELCEDDPEHLDEENTRSIGGEDNSKKKECCGSCGGCDE